MRSLSLLVPALFWPDPAAPHSYEGLDLPQVALLLGRGRRVEDLSNGPGHWLAHRFGVEPRTQPPLAAIARLGSGGARDTRVWMRADPVHLQPQGTELFLTRGADLAIDSSEADAIVAALNAFFAADGLHFVAGSVHSWFVALERMPDLVTVPLELAHGHSIDALLPRGGDAQMWLQRFNEAQMLLHGLPVNEAREQRAVPTINSLWLWGAGTLPPTARRWVDAVYAADPLPRGMGLLAGTRVRMLPAEFAALEPDDGAALVQIDDPTTPASTGDQGAWRTALADFEQRWLRPALASLRAGRLEQLELTGFGGRHGRTTLMQRGDLWKFWRRPATLPSQRPRP